MYSFPEVSGAEILLNPCLVFVIIGSVSTPEGLRLFLKANTTVRIVNMRSVCQAYCSLVRHMIHLGECLPSIHEALSFIPSTNKPRAYMPVTSASEDPKVESM